MSDNKDKTVNVAAKDDSLNGSKTSAHDLIVTHTQPDKTVNVAATKDLGCVRLCVFRKLKKIIIMKM